jgi:hypothetical protein
MASVYKQLCDEGFIRARPAVAGPHLLEGRAIVPSFKDFFRTRRVVGTRPLGPGDLRLESAEVPVVRTERVSSPSRACCPFRALPRA